MWRKSKHHFLEEFVKDFTIGVGGGSAFYLLQKLVNIWFAVILLLICLIIYWLYYQHEPHR